MKTFRIIIPKTGELIHQIVLAPDSAMQMPYGFDTHRRIYVTGYPEGISPPWRVEISHDEETWSTIAEVKGNKITFDSKHLPC